MFFFKRAVIIAHNLLIAAINVNAPHRFRETAMGFGAIIVNAIQIWLNYIKHPNGLFIF